MTRCGSTPIPASTWSGSESRPISRPIRPLPGSLEDNGSVGAGREDSATAILPQPDGEDRDSPWKPVLDDLAYTLWGFLVSLFLLWYLHEEAMQGPGRSMAWAAGCGVIAGVVVRRAVRTVYENVPRLVRRPLDLATVIVGSTLASTATLGNFSLVYLVSRLRETLALGILATLVGLGIAGVVWAHGRIEHEVEERERLEQDLRLARDIQESLLLSELPTLPWVQARAVNVPSRSVGGDYYEVFDVERGRFGFALGDVSGKGVPAALLMSTLQSAFLGLCGVEDDLARICRRINDFLSRRTSPERYATFFVARLHPGAGGVRMEFVNAGHNPPLLVGGGSRRRLFGGGMPLGLFPEAEYQVQETTLTPGDLLVCYTDGVTEAMNAEEEMFGEDRLEEVVERCTSGDADGVLEAVRRAVLEHTRDQPQYDDLTLLVLKLDAADGTVPASGPAGPGVGRSS